MLTHDANLQVGRIGEGHSGANQIKPSTKDIAICKSICQFWIIESRDRPWTSIQEISNPLNPAPSGEQEHTMVAFDHINEVVAKPSPVPADSLDVEFESKRSC